MIKNCPSKTSDVLSYSYAILHFAYRSFPSEVYFHENESPISDNRLYRYCDKHIIPDPIWNSNQIHKISRPFNRNNGKNITLKGPMSRIRMLSNFHHKIIGSTLYHRSPYWKLRLPIAIADWLCHSSHRWYRNRFLAVLFMADISDPICY